MVEKVLFAGRIPWLDFAGEDARYSHACCTQTGRPTAPCPNGHISLDEPAADGALVDAGLFGNVHERQSGCVLLSGLADLFIRELANVDTTVNIVALEVFKYDSPVQAVAPRQLEQRTGQTR